MTRVGRPATYTPETVIRLSPGEARTKLQRGSERRAIVNFIVDKQGKATLGELNEHFGFETKPRVMALVHAGWLEVES